jgi:F-box-like
MCLEEYKPRSYPFPFHRLPVELLVAIFQEFERSSRRYTRGRVPSSAILSHVCRLWRDVALDTATLWTDIRIYDPCMAHISHYSEACFERSKSSLIDVHYHLHVASHAIVTAMSSLLPHIARVRRLTIIAADDMSLLTALENLNQAAVAPCLESLRISLLDPPVRFASHNPGILGREPLPFFAGGAPLLRSVQLNGIPILSQNQFMGITSFTLRMHARSRRVYLPHFLHFLTNVSQTLIRLRIWEVEFYPEPLANDNTFQPVELPLLESLDISQVRILPYLRIPRLRKLYLKDVDDETLETFMKLSSSWELSNLQSLKLDELSLSCFEDQTAVVRGLPLLTELMIWDCAHDKTFLSLLTQRHGAKTRRRRMRGMAHHDRSYLQTPSNSSADSENLGIIMPHLRFLTLSSEDSWPLIQAIIHGRIKKGIVIDCIRFPNTACVDSRPKEFWLVDRDIDYEPFDYYTEETAELGDSEWVADENYFERDRWKLSTLAGDEDHDSDEDYGDETDFVDSEDFGEDTDE